MSMIPDEEWPTDSTSKRCPVCGIPMPSASADNRTARFMHRDWHIALMRLINLKEPL